MTSSALAPGEHSYESILAGIERGDYAFASSRTFSGDTVPIIGLSDEQFRTLERLSARYRFSLALYGSRIAGPRVRQRTLSPVLEVGLSLVSRARHPSVGLPGIQDVLIRKDVIKEYGRENPLTSDLSVALLIGHSPPCDSLERRALYFERTLNSLLNVTFQLRVYLLLHGFHFPFARDFLNFGREHYIKKDLPANHRFSDQEIDEAFGKTFVLLGDHSDVV